MSEYRTGDPVCTCRDLDTAGKSWCMIHNNFDRHPHARRTSGDVRQRKAFAHIGAGYRAMSVRVTDTVVVEAARAELLGALYAWERWVRDRQSEDARDAKAGAVDIHTGRIVNADPDHWPTHVPLFENKWESDDDDILLAAREAMKIGDLELNEGTMLGPMVRLTIEGRKKAVAYAALSHPDPKEEEKP